MKRRWMRRATFLSLPLLAGCWWLEPEPGPGEWRLRSGTIADFQPHHSAALFEQDGYAQLLLECGQGPIIFSVATGRDPLAGDSIRLPVRYRLDDAAPVAITALTGGNYLYFSDPQQATGEDPFVARMIGARRLILRIDWSESDRQTMRFDLSRTGDAVARLRETCRRR